MIKVAMYKFSTISDVHVRHKDDERYGLLLNFLNSNEVANSNLICLLGDIFDLMVGNHVENFNLYREFFDRLNALMDSGKEVIYFEGNHDLHLEGFFKSFLPKMKIQKEPLQFKISNKNVLFSHGDEYDLENTTYQNYKKIIRTKFCELLANDFVSYKHLKFLGERASKNSRKRNRNYPALDIQNLQKRYQKNILKTLDQQNEKIDYVVFGHSHILEEAKVGEGSIQIINNGYFPSERKFIHYNGIKLELLNI